MSTVEWGVLAPGAGLKPWMFPSRDLAIKAMKRLEGLPMITIDGTEVRATGLKLVRRVISAWEEVDHEDEQGP
jgi:hypothetical protein